MKEGGRGAGGDTINAGYIAGVGLAAGQTGGKRRRRIRWWWWRRRRRIWWWRRRRRMGIRVNQEEQRINMNVNKYK